MRKILVTGGSVFVSRRVAEYFVQLGDDVTVLNRNTRKQVEGVRVIQADRHQLSDELKGMSFDALIDVTAYTKSDVETLMDALDEVKDVVLISSSAVYPEGNIQPFEETQNIGYNSRWKEYGTGKIGAETALFERMPNAYVIRPAYLYGTYENLYREPFVFDAALAHRPFYLPEKEMFLQFFHVDDLCRMIDAILKTHPSHHIFNAGNEETVTAQKWAELCYEAANVPFEAVFVDDTHPIRSYFPFSDFCYSLDVTRQRELIGETIPLSEGLKQTFEWYCAQNPEVVRKPYFETIDEKIAPEKEKTQ